MRLIVTARAGRGATRALAGAMGMALALGMVGCSGSDSDAPGTDAPAAVATPDATPETDTPEGSPSPHTGAATPDASQAPPSLPPETKKAVDEGSEDYYDVLTDVLTNPDDTDPQETEDLSGVTGAALEEMLNTLTEYQANDWRVEGRVTVVSQRVVRVQTDPEQIVVRACVDNSAVRLLDSAGNEVPNSRPPHPRTLNILTLVRDSDSEDSWVVATQRPATRPNC